MSMVIANNISAINTKRQFSTSSTGMAGAMERLSSGFKINTGKDDPSGLLISEKLRSQINGLQRAQQNTDEAMNVLGIAEGALNEMNSILKKMKALAIHAASNGVTSPDQVAADQAEMDSAIQTLDRIAQTTKFSDQTLLNGSKDIVYNQDTMIKSTQQNSLINTRESGFYQIFKRDDYAVSINFTGTKAADITTGHGVVDFTQQASRAYLEVDTGSTWVNGAANQTQVKDGAFTQAQQFTLTGALGSRSFSFKQGETVATMVSQIKSAADTTGINAALVFNSDQMIDKLDGGAGDLERTSAVLRGAKNSDGQAVSLDIGVVGDPDILADIKDALDGAKMSFALNWDETSGDFTLDLLLDGEVAQHVVTALDTWDGTNPSLQTILAGVTWNTGNSDLNDALAAAATAGGIQLSDDLNAAAMLVDNFVLDTSALPATLSYSVTGFFNTTGTETLTVDFSRVDLQAIFDGLDSDDKLRLIDAVLGSNLSFDVALSGDDDDFDVTISLRDTAATFGPSITLNSKTMGQDATGDIAGYTVGSGAFAGVEVTLTTSPGVTSGAALTGTGGTVGLGALEFVSQMSFKEFMADPSVLTLGVVTGLNEDFLSVADGEAINIDLSGLDLTALMASMSSAQQREFYDSVINNTLRVETELDGTDLNFNLTIKLTNSDGADFGSIVLNSIGMGGINPTNGTLLSGPYTTTAVDGLAGMQITITASSSAPAPAGTVSNGVPTSGPVPITNLPKTGTMASGALSFIASAMQTGGVDYTGSTAGRETGTVAIFNNDLATGTGAVTRGVTSLELVDDAADTIEFGFNTDGQGRIYVKFLDDNSFELYKDASMSAESLVATGTNGKEIREANNSGLSGLILELEGEDLVNKRGVYISFAGIEGTSENANGSAGVTYNNSMFGTGKEGTWSFDETRTLFTGVELGVNTSDTGEIYFKNVVTYDDKTDSVSIQVLAYKHKDMKDQDLVASSEVYTVRDNGNDATSLTIVLNEIRSADNTTGTGLGIVLSVGEEAFQDIDKSMTLTGTATFNNLGARIYAEDYGSNGFIKVTQDKGALFSYYGSGGDMNSVKLIDAGLNGTVFQQTGQDATLSVNGREVKTDGLTLNMATQDIQAYFLFNQGKVGSTTLAQVGYELGSIFTKIGALNLGEKYSKVVDENTGDEKERDDKYQYLSGLLCNAGHVTNENLNNFQGGMQLQLGEGAGDQNRTVVALKGMTSEDLGRVTKGGYWETGSSVWSEKSFTLKDVMGGGTASLSANATLAMEIIEQAVNDVSYMRATIGAMQTNLLQTNSNNLSVTIENLTKTESGIRDADMADEMTDFTKFQVLQNAAMTMMSQANQSSQNILQLLR